MLVRAEKNGVFHPWCSGCTYVVLKWATQHILDVEDLEAFVF